MLFHAAAGGVGLIACQSARAMSAAAHRHCGQRREIAIAEGRRRSAVINYNREDLVARMKGVGGRRSVGGPVFPTASARTPLGPVARLPCPPSA